MSWRSLLPVLVSLGLLAPAHAYDVLQWQGREGDLMTNGGFEEAGAEDEVAADWSSYTQRREPDGVAVVERSPDAHSGAFSLRLMSADQSIAGLNRPYRAKIDPGKMLPLTLGWAEFWYKAISSETGNNLRICIIGMPADCGGERGRRHIYEVPPEHIGDGLWHRGTIHFCYTPATGAKYVQFAPRINEGGTRGAGEMLIDDIAIYPAGPSIAVEVGGFSKPLARVGETVKLRGRVRNTGTLPATSVYAVIALDGPAELIPNPTPRLPEIEPGKEHVAEWSIRITGVGPITARVFVGGESYNEADWPAVMMGVESLDGGEVAFATASARLRYIPQTDTWGTLAVDARPGGRGPWRPAGVIPFLGWATLGEDKDIIVFPAFKYDALPNTWGGDVTDAKNRIVGMRIQFTEGANGALRLTSELWGGGDPFHTIAMPWLLIGGADKTEACLPGLEYLAANEASCNELDGKYPLSLRWAPHPHKITIPFMSVSFDWGTAGLAWEPLEKWDRERDRAQPIFSVPNRFGDQDNNLFAFALPGAMQGRGENRMESKTPYDKPDVWLKVSSELFFTRGSNTDAAVAWYLKARGLPDDPPLPWSIEDGLRLCLDSSEHRWVQERSGWHGTSAWERGAGPSPTLARLLWIDSLRTDDEAKRALWRSRALATAQALGGRIGLDSGLYIGDLWSAIERDNGSARGAIRSQQAEGGWGHVGRAINAEWELGERGKAVSGTTARQATSLLQFAAATGDQDALAAGLKALEFCNQHDPIPRGGQTWEVPLHTPDIIVAGHALMGHVIAYELTGDRRWIEKGRHWAYAGIPFIYLWKAPERPIMPYATIPVIGTSAWRNPWYGRPVQWCGIVFIHPLQRFAYYDAVEDWDSIARGLIIASMQQQVDFDRRVYPDTKDTPEEDLYWRYPSEGLDRLIGTYCDNYRLFDDRDYCWQYMISPNSHTPLSGTMMHELGIQPLAQTKVLRTPQGPIHVTAPVPIDALRLDREGLSTRLVNPEKWPIRVMVARIGKPDAVTVDGKPIPEGDVLNLGAECWSYRSKSTICVVQTTGSEIALDGVSHQAPSVPDTSAMTAWEFDEPGNPGGFVPEHDISEFAVRGGRLHITASGDDPWFTVHGLALDAGRYRTLKLRLSVAAEEDSAVGVFFSHPGEGVDPERQTNVHLKCDGRMHEIAIPMGEHAAWTGTIATIRIDPTHGLPTAKIEVDWIRFE